MIIIDMIGIYWYIMFSGRNKYADYINKFTFFPCSQFPVDQICGMGAGEGP